MRNTRYELNAHYTCRECSTNQPLFEKTKPIFHNFRLKTMISQKTNPIQTQFKANLKPGTRPALCGNNAASHKLIATILPLYKTICHQYYTRSYRRCSSMEEHSFRKAEVEGSTPSIGCSTKMRVCLLLRVLLKLLLSRERAIFSLTRRRFKIAAVVAKATSRTNFESTTQREEIAAVRSKNEFLEVPNILRKCHYV